MDVKKPRKLTRQRKAFIAEYLKCFNGAEAARRAGYSHIQSNSMAAQVMKDPQVKAAIEEALAEAHMSAAEALKLLAAMARGEQPTKTVVANVGGASNTTETFDKLEALDKVVRVHGKYRDNVDLNGTVEIIFRDETDAA